MPKFGFLKFLSGWKKDPEVDSNSSPPTPERSGTHTLPIPLCHVEAHTEEKVGSHIQSGRNDTALVPTSPSSHSPRDRAQRKPHSTPPLTHEGKWGPRTDTVRTQEERDSLKYDEESPFFCGAKLRTKAWEFEEAKFNTGSPLLPSSLSPKSDHLSKPSVRRVKRRRHRRQRTTSAQSRESHHSSPSPALKTEQSVTERKSCLKGRPPLLRRSTDIALPSIERSVSSVQLTRKVVPTYRLESTHALPDPHCILGRLGHSLDSHLEISPSPANTVANTSICVVWDLNEDKTLQRESTRKLTPKKVFSSSEEISSEFFEACDSEDAIERATSSISPLTLPQNALGHLKKGFSSEHDRGVSSHFPKGSPAAKSLLSSPEVSVKPRFPPSGQRHTTNLFSQKSRKVSPRTKHLPCSPSTATSNKQNFRGNTPGDRISDISPVEGQPEEQGQNSSLLRSTDKNCTIEQQWSPLPPSSEVEDSLAEKRTSFGRHLTSARGHRRRAEGQRDSAYFSTDDASSEYNGKVGSKGVAGKAIKEIVERSIHDSLNALPQLIASEVNRQVEERIRSSVFDSTNRRRRSRASISQNKSFGPLFSSRSLDMLIDASSEASSPEPFGPVGWSRLRRRSSARHPAFMSHSNSCNDLLDRQGYLRPTNEIFHRRVFTPTSNESSEGGEDLCGESSSQTVRDRNPLYPFASSLSLVCVDPESDSEHSMEWDYSFLQQEQGMCPEGDEGVPDAPDHCQQ